MADPTIGQGYNQDIAFRYKPNQTAAEFYSTKTGQAFSSPDQLASYINTNYAGSNATGQNVFDVLAGGYRAQALSGIKNDLNNYQNDLYNTPDTSPTRKSSSIPDAMTSEQGNYDTYLKEYTDLKTKLEALKAPNYQQTYTELTNQQGIPQLNSDIANIDAERNDLPYINRAASGNAGIETESQLSADTAQKDIPLYVKQQNLIDRLKLAQAFVDNSMKFKEMDANQARQSLTDAIGAVSEAINLSRTHLSDLSALKKEQDEKQKAAEQFAFDNRVNQPFYDIGGTIYRTSDGKAYSTPQQFFADGGAQDFSNVQKVTKEVKPLEVSAGASLYDPITHELLATAPKTYKTGSGGGGGSGGSSGGSAAAGLTSKQLTRISQIIKANPGEWGHAADQIDTELGKGTASKADNILKTAYLIPSDAQIAEQIWLSLPENQQTLDEWNKGLLVFQQAHSYNIQTATKLYKQFVPKPRS